MTLEELNAIVDGVSKPFREQIQAANQRISELEQRIAAIPTETRVQVGEPGPQGERGFPGEPGPAGPAGAQGVPGEKGESGEAGPIGPQGPQGDKGERGEKGESIQGESGPVGEKGERGERGEIGPVGPQGEIGQRGEVGPQGEPGLPGESIQGPAGPQGERGEKGDSGERGERGEQGLRGEKGDTGETGAVGQRGDPGEPGPQGQPGRNVQPAEVEAVVDGVLARHVDKWGLDFERRAQDLLQRIADKIQKPKDGRDAFELEDLAVEHDGDGMVTLSFIRGELKRSFELRLPRFKDKGVFNEKSSYREGDGVTFAGSFFIAQKDDPQGKPETTNSDWRMAVKRGKDGRDGELKPPKPEGPVNLK